MVFSDCVVIQGSNMAECHPVAFRWPMQAKLNGAKIIHVDPRFTRTTPWLISVPQFGLEQTSPSWAG